jgi:rhomboid protease GluP
VFGGVGPPPPVASDAPVETATHSEPQAEGLPPPDEKVDFRQVLIGLTPRVYITPIIIGINIVLFIIQILSGVNAVKPSIPDLCAWGADFGPLTLGGDWWRLLTSTFLHIGFLHILFNMLFLAGAGMLVERMVGHIGFLVLYLMSGLCGSLASLFIHPMLVSAGASGAIFGVYGALLGVLLLNRSGVPAKTLIQLRNQGLGFIAYNLVFGMTQPNIDTAAHIGGLLAGFLGGLVLSQPLTRQSLATRPLRNRGLCLLGVSLVIGGMIGVYAKHADLAKVANELTRLESDVDTLLERVNRAAEQAKQRTLSDDAMADILARDVLPEWRAMRSRLSQLKNVPEELKAYVRLFGEYLQVYQEAWEIFVQGLREGDDRKIQLGVNARKRADAIAQQMLNPSNK